MRLGRVQNLYRVKKKKRKKIHKRIIKSFAFRKEKIPGKNGMESSSVWSSKEIQRAFSGSRKRTGMQRKTAMQPSFAVVSGKKAASTPRAFCSFHRET